ncbi:MAG: GxxExxY protein [Pyrinomonadaceae bacterium]|nr:GxxExxY protein [Pyrinomonadaceae bacterium]
MEEKVLYKELSYKIVGLAFEVHRELGFGFLEKENGILACQQAPIRVPFHGQIVGEYVADIVVEDSIILELKALELINEIHKAQTLNYLKATNFRLALLLNFGKYKLEYERLVL